MSDLQVMKNQGSVAPLSDEGLPKTEDEAIEQVGQLMSQGENLLLVIRWNIGKICAHALGKAREDGSTWDKKIVKKIAEDNGMDSPANLYNAITFYEAFPEADRVVNMQLSWTSAHMIARLEDPATREKLEKQVVEGDLSSREVTTLVRDAQEKEKAKGVNTKRKGVTHEARNYFRKISKMIEEFEAKLQDEVKKQPRMSKLLESEDRTPDVDYIEVTEGDVGSLALVHQIGASAAKLSTYLTTCVDKFKKLYPEPSIGKTSQSGRAAGPKG